MPHFVDILSIEICVRREPTMTVNMLDVLYEYYQVVKYMFDPNASLHFQDVLSYNHRLFI